MDIPTFIAKWRQSALKERSAAQEHFIDLCHALNVETPADADPTGERYTFEKGAEKAGGGDGWADVWKKDHFAWEYKGKHADLRAAYLQLLQYKDDLGNPPLLVVCDLDRFEIHTNFTNTVKKVYRISLDDLDRPENLRVLRAVFTDPLSLRPGQTTEDVTEEAAARFGQLAAGLQRRGVHPHRAAHFLVQMLFCLFAEDAGLLRNKVFSKLLTFAAKRPERFVAEVTELFGAMQTGGDYAFEDVPHFNGGLFATIDPVPLTAEELAILADAAHLDWSSVEPAIFGTLFERSLDPAKRSQLGAHYTGRADIERVVEPVLMAPLRRRWEQVRAEADAIKAAWDAATTPRTRDNRRAEFAAKLASFQQELATIRVLDPACGSGNFLYVALAKLLDLEKEVLTYGATNGLPMGFPTIRPAQLHGLEINEYARELAQVVIWIGYLQWMIGNGYSGLRTPILEPLETIRLQDALLDRSGPVVKEATWPEADVIIGNPPFLGGKRLRAELGDEYVDDLFRVYRNRVPREADLVAYFFEKARAEIEADRAQRAGLLATNSIRGGANREVLKRIKQTGDIYMAWDDEPWILNGAAVRISIIGFDDGADNTKMLDGQPVASINSDLTATTDITSAARLIENAGIAYQGFGKAGPFDIDPSLAEYFLSLPKNPNGRTNADVVKPWVNGMDITRRPRGMYIIDFGLMSEEEAALYEAPFEFVRQHVKPLRDENQDRLRRVYWWRLGRSGQELRRALSGLGRYIATPTVSKFRVFVWLPGDVVPDHQLNFFAREDDYFFGVLHSRAHEVWSLRMGTSLEDRPRYTPTTCFETFPLPWPPGQEPADDPCVQAIAAAAKRLDDLRTAWLNPEGASAAELKKRTLTNLYNQRPTWLTNAHAALNRAVWAAYGWPTDEDPATVPEDTILERLLALNLERAHGPFNTQ